MFFSAGAPAAPKPLATLNWLAFDTSTERLSIAVSVGGRVWAQTLPGGTQASATLIPTALHMLAQAGASLAQLQAIVFGRGPGSFTGVRTACSVAQGLAFGAGIAVLPVDTLLAVAEDARLHAPSPNAPLTVLAVLDARMGEVYSAAYDWDGAHWHTRSPLQVGPPEQVRLPQGQPAHRQLLAGNAATLYGERLPAIEHLQAWPQAEAMLRLAPGLAAQGGCLPPEQALPLYVRDKVAQTTAEREAARRLSA